jgi:hypothetical protein
MGGLALMAALWYASVLVRYDLPQEKGLLDLRDRMNPYFMEYLHNEEYGYEPLTDPVFLGSSALAGLVVFGVPGFAIGVIGGRASVRTAGVVLLGGTVASVLAHRPWILPGMRVAYVVDLGFAMLSFIILWLAGAKLRENVAGGPTRVSGPLRQGE